MAMLKLNKTFSDRIKTQVLNCSSRNLVCRESLELAPKWKRVKL